MGSPSGPAPGPAPSVRGAGGPAPPSGRLLGGGPGADGPIGRVRAQFRSRTRSPSESAKLRSETSKTTAARPHGRRSSSSAALPLGSPSGPVRGPAPSVRGAGGRDPLSGRSRAGGPAADG